MRRSIIRSVRLTLILFIVSVQTFAFSTYHSRNRKRPHNNLKMSSISTEQQNEDMKKAKRLISSAISVGAPAYNSGNIKECARVYMETALEISTSLELPQTLKNGLEAAINTEYSDSKEEAWGFRRQFDSILEYQVPFMPSSKKNEYTLEKFVWGDSIEPLTVHDNVMGGISQGYWDKSKKKFSGNVLTDYNGGFASLRWRMNPIQNWSYAKGIYLKVKHSKPESHSFRITLKDMTCEQVRGANYKNIFSNPNSENNNSDELIFIPFEAFNQIERMGQPLSGGLTFNRGAVTEVGIMAIKGGVVGEFELEILEWGLYM